MCLSIFRFMDLSEEFEEILKKNAILKSLGAVVQNHQTAAQTAPI